MKMRDFKRMRRMSGESKKNSGYGGIWAGVLAGVIFLATLFLLKWSLWIALLLAGGSYVGLWFLFRPRRKIGDTDVEDLPHGEALLKQMEEARADFDAITHTMNQIYDQEVWEQAKKLKQISEKILRYLEQNPEKIADASVFIDYYQETASQILKQYVELQRSELETPQVQELKGKMRTSLDTLNTAFEEQLQKLMRDEITDLDAELQVLEEMVKMEM